MKLYWINKINEIMKYEINECNNIIINNRIMYIYDMSILIKVICKYV